ncbi:UNVERIFIED_CONTAM: U-box domain-containing protein 35 [Sesamum radiatum]|uniref:RING-type E3 ubiquitin transferase n=1 Tax=Sesamum radiatum TaxID=300843 RepID=A0AAW2KYT7_SESRA
MWPPTPNPGERMPPMPRLVAVAIDKDKGSQVALKWAIENLLGKGQTVILVHVKLRQSMTGLTTSPSLTGSWPSNNSDISDEIGDDPQIKELFLPFRVYCTRKDVQCYDVVLDDTDVARALIEFVKQSAIDMLVIGASAKGSIFRFKVKDIAGTVLKGVPDFCTVYVIHKGKISSTKAACRPAPSILSPLRNQIMLQANSKYSGDQSVSSASSRSSFTGHSRPGSEPSPRARQSDSNFIKSPFTHRRAPNGKAYELSTLETDISFVSSGRRSVDVYPTYSESFEGSLTPPRLSGFSDVDSQGYDSWTIGRRSLDILPLDIAASPEPDKAFSGQTMDEVEAEMRRLKQGLQEKEKEKANLEQP